jgi:hypothetical protein
MSDTTRVEPITQGKKVRGRKPKYHALTLKNDFPVETPQDIQHNGKDYVKDSLGRKWRVHPKTGDWVLQKVVGPRPNAVERKPKVAKEGKISKPKINGVDSPLGISTTPKKSGAGRPPMMTIVAQKSDAEASRCKIGTRTTHPDPQGFFYIVQKMNKDSKDKVWAKLEP